MAERVWGTKRAHRGSPVRRWRRPSLGLFLVLLLLVLSCTGSLSHERPLIAPGTSPALERSRLGDEQRESLRYVFYEHTPAPPKPTAGEIAALEHDLEHAPPVEIEELRRLFGQDLELLAYATRDTDRDGVLDYRISEYHGKFFEGDVDLDGDGVRNVYDAAPYDPERGGVDLDGDGAPEEGSFADRDGDGIPDHLDWSKPKSPELAAVQTGLFRDFDVMLVERNARFTPGMVHAIDDALRLVFGEPMPTLRTIAIEEQLLLVDDHGDNGFMLGQTQTLSIYASSLRGADDLAILGLMVHELGHAWQLALDFDEDRLRAENKKMHFPHGEFTTQLERHGWRVDRQSIGEGYHHALYWPHFYATAPRYLYKGSSSHEWAEFFDHAHHEHGHDFLDSTDMVSKGMVGPYAMTSPWEWHADYLMASVYNRMDRRLIELGGGAAEPTSAVLRRRMLRAVQSQWSRYDYRNSVGTSIERELGESFELTEAELDQLVERYVIPLADLPMLSEMLEREAQVFKSQPPTLSKLREAVEERGPETQPEATEPVEASPMPPSPQA